MDDENELKIPGIVLHANYRATNTACIYTCMCVRTNQSAERSTNYPNILTTLDQQSQRLLGEAYNTSTVPLLKWQAYWLSENH